MKKNSFLFVIIATLLLVSCSEYQRLLKSTDHELKFEKAVEYYNKKKYIQAQTLLDEVASYLKGTERSHEVLMYLAKSYFGMKDYVSASEYFKTYVKTYPKGEYVSEAKYMVGYCYYLDSPDARLEQSITDKGVAALQEFIDIYPTDERVPQAAKLLDELNDKLAYKEFLSARLYYNLGNYLGNNYLAAVVTAQNTMKNYPATKHREELSFLILEGKWAQALESKEEKKAERYQDTIDEYYSFIGEFPASKHRAAADKIFKAASK